MSHTKNEFDKNPLFRIDPITRNITNESGKKIFLAQRDHKSERFNFVLPRVIDGHDMSECDKVEIHFTNTDADTLEEIKDVYTVKDLMVDPSDKDRVKFTWEIENNATQLAGKLEFSITFICEGEEKVLEYSFGTTVFKGIMIAESYYHTENVLKPYITGVVAEWKKEIIRVSTEGVKAVEDAKGDILQEIQGHADAVTQAKDDAISEITGIKDDIVDAKNEALDVITDAQEKAEEAKGEIVSAREALEQATTVVKNATTVAENATEAVENAVARMEETSKTTIKDVQAEGEKVTSNANAVIGGIMTAFADATAQIGAKGKEATDAVEDAQNTAIESISGAKDDALDSIEEQKLDAENYLSDRASRLNTNMTAVWETVSYQMDAKTQEATSKMNQTYSDTLQWISEAEREAKKAIENAGSQACGSVVTLQEQAVSDIANKHTLATDDIIQKHTDAVNEIQIIADSLPPDYMELSEDVSNKANAIKGTASGDEVVITDISPDTHTLNVKVNGVDNPENVTVARLGKNILCFKEDCTTRYDIPYVKNMGVTWEYKPDKQEFVLTGTSNRNAINSNLLLEYLRVEPFIRSGKKYVVTLERINGSITGGTSATKMRLYIGSRNLDLPFPTSENKVVTEIIDGNEGSGIMSLFFGAGTQGVVFNDYTFRMKLELGDTATEWEPATCTTYTPNADGIVEGMTSLYPITTIMTNADNAVIECEYNRDTNKVIANTDDAVSQLHHSVESLESQLEGVAELLGGI